MHTRKVSSARSLYNSTLEKKKNFVKAYGNRERHQDNLGVGKHTPVPAICGDIGGI